MKYNLRSRKRKFEDDDETTPSNNKDKSPDGNDKNCDICHLENSKIKINRADYAAMKDVMEIMHNHPRKRKYSYECNDYRYDHEIYGLSRLHRTKKIIDGISDEQQGYRITTLNLSHYPNKTLPQSMFDLDALESLNLYNARDLEALPPAVGRLKNLKNLKLDNMFSLKCLPNEICQLSNLQVLTVDKYPQIKSLPKDFVNLQSIVKLSFSIDYESKKDIFSVLARLKNLKELYLLESECKIWKNGLPESIGKCSSLVKLKLHGWDSFCEIPVPDVFHNLTNLRELELCELGLQNIPNSLGSLVNLVKLRLNGCYRFETLPEVLGELVNLEYLDLGKTGFEELPASIATLNKLVKLDLSESQTKTLPESFGNLINLRELSLRRSYITELPESFGNLIKLEKLDLAGTWYWINFPTSFEKLANLLELNLRGMSKKEDRSATFCVILPKNLVKLKLTRITGVSCFPSSLQELDLCGSTIKDICESKMSPSKPENTKFEYIFPLRKNE